MSEEPFIVPCHTCGAYYDIKDFVANKWQCVSCLNLIGPCCLDEELKCESCTDST